MYFGSNLIGKRARLAGVFTPNEYGRVALVAVNPDPEAMSRNRFEAAVVWDDGRVSVQSLSDLEFEREAASE